MPIVQVALPVHLPVVFDYRCNAPVTVGMRVSVPFRRNHLVGVVVAVVKQSHVTTDKLRDVSAVLDHAIPEELIHFCQWVANYYHAPPGEVFHTALPKLLRLAKPLPQPKTVYGWQANGAHQEVSNLLKNAPKQWALWQIVQHAEAMPSCETLDAHMPGWRSFAKPLLEKKLLEKLPYHTATQTTASAQPLTPAQEQVVDAIRQQGFETFQSHVLYGVTGSGKTEVYLHLIADVLAQGKQALVLVPEISLTPQTIARFKARFGNVVQSQHSRRSDSERVFVWQESKQGKAKVIIGTRSAIFLPFQNLGIIVVDEAHDLSFKQQEGIRYHARDLAAVRAKQLHIPVVFGSATPALEHLYHARHKRYHWHQLTERATGAKHAHCIIDDLGQNSGHLALSEFSLKKLQHTLDQGLQAMVFINRRGFSPALHCLACGHTETCTQCDTTMTVHKHPPHLLCHHCGSSRPLSGHCPQCQAQQRIMLGVGTEKVEQQLQQYFPQHTVKRIDRDTTSKKQDWDNIYQQVHTNKIDILVGTQMLAKGHDFPKVALVIIVDVDQSLLSADFRASEYLGQLITQVSGRAGRAQHSGTAILQTRYPEHPVLQTVLHQGYLALAEQLLEERKQASLPPASHMVLLRAESDQAPKAKQFLTQAKALLPDNACMAMGPLPAPMEKRAGKYRYLLVLQSARKASLQQVLQHWVPQLYQIKTNKTLRWHLDVDPVLLH